MVNNHVLFCNNSLGVGENACRCWAPFHDVILLIDHVSLTLDDVTSFLRFINVRNTYMTVAGFLQCNGGKLEDSEGYNCFFIVSCVLESK